MAEAISPERWQQVKLLFHSAVDLPVDQRKTFLEKHCVDDPQLLVAVERMIAADGRASSFLEGSPVAEFRSTETDWSGKRIGPYRILEELGRGGMGAVYLARREDEFEKLVAIKIIKRGMDTDDMLRRFRNERQILAQLDHPNIARLLDGGTTEDGLPYFVMEYVKGANIDDYCKEQNLTVTEQLKLFQQVCAAVNYAHQHLAIHRDIKPSNILVTADGTPKLLDFGIAKLLSPNSGYTGDTATVMQMMTPEYASPEQARGEQKISTASDIYSLGVVLYQLLTGESPYSFESRRPDDIARVICETEPERPSRVGTKQPTFEKRSSKLLRGDLDNILLMALRKDPSQRYSSVEQFSEDLRRHLEGLPVIARPVTLTYRTGKFIQRHRAATIGAGLVALTLVGGICTTVYQAREANRERARAERRFSEVRQLANSVVFKYHDAIQTLPGSTKVREMLVKDALTYLDNLSRESTGDRGLQRELALAYLKVADVQGKIYDANLGDMPGAVSSYRKAIDLFESLAQNSSDVQAQIDLRNAYQTVALTIGHSGDRQAREFIDKAIRLSEDLGNRYPNDPDHQLMLARSYILKVDSSVLPLSERLATFARALVIVERLLQQQPSNREALKSLGIIHQRMGDQSYRAAKEAATKDPSESARLFRQAAEHHRLSGLAVDKLVKLDPKNNVYLRLEAIAANNLGEALLETGETKTGVTSIGRALVYFESNARTDAANLNAQYELALSLKTYMRALLRDKQVVEAKRQYEKVAAITEQLIKKDSRNREYMLAAVDLREETGDLMLSLRNYPEALEQYKLARLYLEKVIELVPNSRPGGFARSDEKFGDYHAALAESTQGSKAKNYWSEARRLYQSALDATKATTKREELDLKIAKCDKALAGN